jgi:hypothetical protein
MSVCERTDLRNAPPDDVESAATRPVTITVKGKAVTVPGVRIGERTIIASGRWLKIATVQDEELVEGESVPDPDQCISRLKAAKLRADILTFTQGPTNTVPCHEYYYEWDNLAVIHITTFKDWWVRLTDPVQRAVKKAKRVGVVVKEVDFDDPLVEGIRQINDETPVRQGKIFWHYQKDFQTVKAENSTYADRNIFIGAYFGDELIGYVRITTAGSLAHIINILCKQQHYDKRPANALLAKAVEICEQRGFTHLVYCNYVYTDPNSSLTEFKRRNRFEPVLLPRYYLPMTLKGRIALKLQLHRGIKRMLPLAVLRALLRVRSWVPQAFVASLRSVAGR